MKKKPTCLTCHGKGWLLFKAVFQDEQLQRCDECCRFTDDLAAAVAFFKLDKGRHLNRRYYLAAIVVKPAPGTTFMATRPPVSTL